jgi:transcriptional antiterminator NusG
MNISDIPDRPADGDDLAGDPNPTTLELPSQGSAEGEPPAAARTNASVDEESAAEEEGADVEEGAPASEAEEGSAEPENEASAEGGAEEEAAGKEDAEGEGGQDAMEWYVLKVQSNRENSIRDAILRRIKIAGLEPLVAEVVVPTEKVTEMKGGKKRVMEKKFYPGYIIIRLVLNEETWFTIRETPGVGDFVGAGGKPVPMTAEDVARMLGRKEKAEEEKQPRLQINFEKGDRVKIKEGAFENFEGEVDEVIESKGLVRVMVQVFGRPTPVEVEYWQVEPV